METGLMEVFGLMGGGSESGVWGKGNKKLVIPRGEETLGRHINRGKKMCKTKPEGKGI